MRRKTTTVQRICRPSGLPKEWKNINKNRNNWILMQCCRLFNFPPKQVPTRFKSVSLSLNPLQQNQKKSLKFHFHGDARPQSAQIPTQHAVQHRDYIIGTKRAPPLLAAALDRPSWVWELSWAGWLGLGAKSRGVWAPLWVDLHKVFGRRRQPPRRLNCRKNGHQCKTKTSLKIV